MKQYHLSLPFSSVSSNLVISLLNSQYEAAKYAEFNSETTPYPAHYI